MCAGTDFHAGSDTRVTRAHCAFHVLKSVLPMLTGTGWSLMSA
jgi:hypothetical protein